jgi:NADPH-dependent 2,4-dienoyl-CoA reductase/sulfur reductase-like enzyme
MSDMTASRIDRRAFSRSTLAAAAAAAFPMPALGAGSPTRVVVIGGGFAGASCARTLKKINPNIAVTLVEANKTFTALPMSNSVVAGLRKIGQQQFEYRAITAAGIDVVIAAAKAVDPQARQVVLVDGKSLSYDRLVLAPGIDLRWDAIPGYDRAAAEKMPHAWNDGAQADLLRRQLTEMPDGSTVVMSVPVAPARCPPAPYERASLIAHYLKTTKPRSKLIVLDAKENFSMQRLFQNAWKELYTGLLEWVPLSSGGQIVSVDVASRTIKTDFDSYRANVANIIPPQRAGGVTALAGVADRTGWCPIDPITFESKQQANIHVIGDAAIAGALPKSASTANSAGKLCAAAIVQLLAGAKPRAPELASACYSLLAPGYAISITAKYHPVGDQFIEIEGSGETSPLEAPQSRREEEAKLADDWFTQITGEVFG